MICVSYGNVLYISRRKNINFLVDCSVLLLSPYLYIASILIQQGNVQNCVVYETYFKITLVVIIRDKIYDNITFKYKTSYMYVHLYFYYKNIDGLFQKDLKQLNFVE